MEEETEIVEHFFGVYLLYCTNPKYKGRTYIGYTVNPRRRIKQHNAGKKYGGAWKTSNRGPWNMVLIVHGFPNSTSALRFEWAWQHPHVSRRLKHIPKKKSSQKKFDFCLTVLSEMLKIGPWCRLPLIVRWLDYEFSKNYYGRISPPLHMPVCYGKVSTCKTKSTQRSRTDDILSHELRSSMGESLIFCSLCGSSATQNNSVTCMQPKCPLIAHLICLAKVFCKDGMILPIEGTCPTCTTSVLWGDLIKKKNGCYQYLQEANTNSSSSDSDI
ncbi:structure-specific endonuclease subunit slx1 isoform X2 [Ooceraea biroi]|uniref:Structure-specific endonuclease subunit SLX1 homolog n=1 Tax=Ooceraea biroi TaxID=2015173 RepID=A0A026WCK2_OOCBI|nr:structure-specific endonuclease subunit slx1 isoform X2 [Ooceraea biroi]EZA53653.1 Structure-specific endonuclease subunit slx1 [Ooceraea biroi]